MFEIFWNDCWIIGINFKAPNIYIPIISNEFKILSLKIEEKKNKINKIIKTINNSRIDFGNNIKNCNNIAFLQT